MFRLALWLTFLLIVVIYGIYAFVTVDRRPDEVRIRTMIADTVMAIQNRDLGGTIACVSRHYSDDQGLNYDKLRMLAYQSLTIDTRYTASADIGSLRIDEDDASVELSAEVKAVGGDYIYKRDLTLHLRRERTRHMGVIPTRVWRVVKVENLGLSPDRL